MNFPPADLDPETALLAKRAAIPAYDALLTSCRAAKRPFAVLALDIDNLKRFQDVHSHHSAVKAIRVVSNALADLWTVEGLPCRFGGEEFLLALGGADERAARATAEALRAAVAARIFPDFQTGEPVSVTVSIGVAGTWLPAPTLTDLLRAAEEGVDQAKQTGRNRVCP